METPSCLSLIREGLESWSAKERRIASYIIANPADSVDPSIEELAGRIGVSESTLFRFVRKLGYGGYQQFRIALATETIAGRDTWYEAPEASIDEKSAATVVFRTSIAALEATLAGLDSAVLDSVAQAMATAPAILILGLGGSNAVAQDAFHKFLRTGLPCLAPVDFHLQLMVAAQSGPGSLSLIFSHTGSNTDSLALADEACRSGSTLVAFTSQPKSPLARRSDHVLLTRSPQASRVSEAWSARLAQLALIDSLYVLVMEQLGDRGQSHLEDMRNAIARRRL
ncbi:MAG: MurR/RpiR family transcriptional regulator [Rectinemataceae bacterium]